MNALSAGPDHRTPEPWGTRRLWSLWDMQKLETAAFYTVSTNIQEFQTMVLHGNSASAFGPTMEVIVATRTHLAGLTRQFRGHLEVLGAEITDKAAARLLWVLEQPTCVWSDVAEAVTHLDKCFQDETHSRTLLALNDDEEKLFNPRSPLFGEDFAKKFLTQGVFELDEAAKCLALGRPTAATFHLMRIMELAVRAVARCLQIPDPTQPADRSWGTVLKTIKDGIIKKWPTVADRSKGDGAEFDALYASLDAAKNPWRNTTMHVENKYTDDEAEHIFVAVKGLMKRLASRMDENGEPFA